MWAATPNLWLFLKISVKVHLTHLKCTTNILRIALFFFFNLFFFLFSSDILTYIWKTSSFGSWKLVFFTDDSFKIFNIPSVVSFPPEFG